MGQTHDRYHFNLIQSSLGRLFFVIFLLCLVAAGLSMAGVSIARAQQAGTVTPTAAEFTPTATTPATAVAETLSPTDEGSSQGTAAPVATGTLIPTSTAPTPTAAGFTPTTAVPTALVTINPSATPIPTQAPSLSSQALATPTPNKYFTSLTVKAQNGVTLGENIINGPPSPPPGFTEQSVSQDQLHAASTNSLNVPAYLWSFGCSATSGAMIAAYYDRNGYPNMYTGPTNGGVAPLDSSSWGTWTDGAGASYAQDPLAASLLGLDGRASRGSLDDYWVAYGSSAADPFINHWSEHAPGDAIGDFMKTSQSTYGNTDGSTSFYYQPSSAKYTCNTMAAQGISQKDGTYGRMLFYQARGYTVSDCYLQETDNKYAGGFSFAQYKAEIDAGRPVMLNLAGHTIVGTGYDASSNTVYLNDTWHYETESMPWGGSYAGMQLWSVSIVNLQTTTSNPAPSITSLNPSSANAGGPTFNLTVNGANFISSSVVNWNGSALATTYVNSTQLKASVPSSLIGSTGSVAV
ncbi:MAG: C39 family peptidase, partial [Negativicutes bacterium]|nr:C39 family peptidase [Negativicutes bacterium]